MVERNVLGCRLNGTTEELTSNLFGYLKNLDKLRVMNGGTVVKIYTVAVILRNCHVGFYGCQSSSYFNTRIDDDFLEKYLRVQN